MPSPPANGEYMVAAYVITALVLGGAGIVLLRQAFRVLRGSSGET